MACTLYWTVPQLCRLTNNPLPTCFCMDMIGIHFVCCFFSTHKSQANPQLAFTTCQFVCVRGYSGGPAPPLFPAAASPPPRRRLCVCVCACCLCQRSVCVCQTACLVCCPCLSRGCVVCVFNKTVKPYLFPLSHGSSTREQIRSVHVHTTVN